MGRVANIPMATAVDSNSEKAADPGRTLAPSYVRPDQRIDEKHAQGRDARTRKGRLALGGDR